MIENCDAVDSVWFCVSEQAGGNAAKILRRLPATGGYRQTRGAQGTPSFQAARRLASEASASTSVKSSIPSSDSILKGLLTTIDTPPAAAASC